MKSRKLHNEIQQKMWAYFSPDGYVQVRSISGTKALAREMICQREFDFSGNKITYHDYEKAGYTLEMVIFDLQVDYLEKGKPVTVKQNKIKPQ